MEIDSTKRINMVSLKILIFGQFMGQKVSKNTNYYIRFLAIFLQFGLNCNKMVVKKIPLLGLICHFQFFWGLKKGRVSKPDQKVDPLS